MFFLSDIVDAHAVLHGKNLSVKDELLRENPEQALATVYIPKLPPDAMVVIDVFTDSSYLDDSYYVSATYDQGSNDISNIKEGDIRSGHFPNIRAVHEDIPFDIKILVVAGIIAAISFAIAISHRLGKTEKTKEILLAYPIPILGAIIALVIVEELGMVVYRSIESTSILPPLDLTCPKVDSKIYCVGGRISSISDAGWDTWFLFFIIFIVRSLVGYGIARLAIYTKSDPTNIRYIKNTPRPFSNKEELALAGLSAVIVGLPIEYIVRSASSQLLVYYLSPFYLSLEILVIEIFRMSFLSLFVAEKVLKRAWRFIGEPEFSFSNDTSLTAKFCIQKELANPPMRAFLISYGGTCILGTNVKSDPTPFKPLVGDTVDIRQSMAVGHKITIRVRLGPPSIQLTENQFVSSIIYENVVLHVLQKSDDKLISKFGKRMFNCPLAITSDKQKEKVHITVKNNDSEPTTITKPLKLKNLDNNESFDVPNTAQVELKQEESKILYTSDQQVEDQRQEKTQIKPGNYSAIVCWGSFCASTTFKIESL
jgi:hypothetical protein